MFEELMESYGIFEQDGELFIESEMVEFVMDEFDLYEEDAIDVILESYEEELENISEALDILVEDYGIEEEEAIDLIMESYEDDLLSEASKGAIIGGAGAVAGLALAHRAYSHSRMPIRRRERKLRKAQERLQFHKDTRSYMDEVEASRRRKDAENGYETGANNLQVAKSIAAANKHANRKIYRAQEKVGRAERKLAGAHAKYDRVQQKRQARKEKIKQNYADYRQKRRERKNPPQPEPQQRRRFGLRRNPEQPRPERRSKFGRR